MRASSINFRQPARSKEAPLVALATPSSIGSNLLGDAYGTVTTRQGNGLAIVMGVEGCYSFVTNGTARWRAEDERTRRRAGATPVYLCRGVRHYLL